MAGLALAAIAANAAEPTLRDFAYARQIETPGKAAAYRLALTVDVYRNAARSDLGDLRVFNARGEVVPHSLTHPPGEATLRQPARQLPLFPLRGDPGAALDALRVIIESGKAALNVQAQSMAAAQEPVLSYLVDGRSLDAAVAALQLDWPGDAAEFAGRLQVEASDDLSAWRTVTDAAPVANLHSDGERLIERRVEFPASKAKFWRLSWAGAAPSFALTGARAEPAADNVDTQRSELVIHGNPIAERPGEIAFDLGARLPVDRINFELPERNSIVQIETHSRAGAADPWQWVGKHGFYRLETRNGELENGAVAIQPRSDRYWLARIDQQGSGLGTGVPQLKAGWVPHEVMFLARGEGPFELAYGSGVAEPSEALLGPIPKEVSTLRAKLAAERELGGAARVKPTPPAAPWKTALLWTVIALGVALLAWMAYRLAKKR